MIKLLEKAIFFRFTIYIIIILGFIYFNLSTYDIYMLSRNPMVFLEQIGLKLYNFTFICNLLQSVC